MSITVCGAPMFPRRGFDPIGHCGLAKGHVGAHMLQVETKAEAERMSTKQLDIDLNDAWKPIRDLPDGDEFIMSGNEEELPHHLIADED